MGMGMGMGMGKHTRFKQRHTQRFKSGHILGLLDFRQSLQLPGLAH